MGPTELVILHGRRATCRRARAHRANAVGQAAPLRRLVGRVGLAKPRVAVAVATMHEALKALAFFHVPVASPPPASVHPSHRVSGRCGALRDQPRRRRLFAMRLRGVWASASGIGSGAACRAPGAPQEPCYVDTYLASAVSHSAMQLREKEKETRATSGALVACHIVISC